MLRLRDFLSRRGESLQLETLTGEVGLDRQLPDAEVAGPGLALAARMLELAGDSALVARLGGGARRFAERLTWERSAAETERHLHDIIAGSA